MLVVTPDFPPEVGGIQHLVHRVVTSWTRMDARVVTLAAPGAREFDSVEELDVRRMARSRLGGRKGEVAVLNAGAAFAGLRYRPDIVLSCHITTSPAAWLIGRVLGVPFVQYLYEKEMVARPRLASFAVERARASIAISAHTEDLAVAAGAVARNVHRITPGVDLPSTTVTGNAARTHSVLAISRMEDRYKGHDVLLRAMPLVRARVPDVRLVVVGDGRLRVAYQRLAESLGLSSCVDFVGQIDDRGRDAFLDQAAVLVMPSRLSALGGGEGFGIVYLEAGAHGLPSVAGRVAGALDAVVDGETGLLVDPRDHMAVAEAIAGLLEQPERAEALGRAAEARARGFAWPLISGRVEDLLLGLISVSR